MIFMKIEKIMPKNFYKVTILAEMKNDLSEYPAVM